MGTFTEGSATEKKNLMEKGQFHLATERRWSENNRN